MPNGTWQFHFFPAFFWWVGHMRRCCKTPIGCQNAEYQEILGNAEFIEQKKIFCTYQRIVEIRHKIPSSDVNKTRFQKH